MDDQALQNLALSLLSNQLSADEFQRRFQTMNPRDRMSLLEKLQKLSESGPKKFKM